MVFPRQVLVRFLLHGIAGWKSMCVGGAQSSFMILWRTGSVERQRQNADQSVVCPLRNKAGKETERGPWLEMGDQ